MKQSISRRGFLKGAAAGTASLAVASVMGVSAEENEKKETGTIFNEPAAWDMETDLVVIGTGTASFGAIRAAHEGWEVICVEAASSAGGCIRFSGGSAWLPLNHFSVEQGDTREACLKYMRRNCREVPITDAQLEAFVDNTEPMIEYMDPILMATEKKVAFSPNNAIGDYQVEWEGGLEGARSLSWSSDGVFDGTTAAATIGNAYLEAIEKDGGQILCSTNATDFVYRYDEDGIPEVLGVICEQDGKTIAIKARKGVLCGPGGFDWNDELCASFGVKAKYFSSLSSNDGTMLLAVMKLGAKLINTENAYGMLAYKERAEEQKETGQPANLAMERYFPRQIIVNQRGRRFFDETGSYDSCLSTFGVVQNYPPYDYENLPAWEIFDEEFVEKNGFNATFFIGEKDENGIPLFVKKADTLEELAEITGIDQEGLLEEVAKWNQFCADGADRDFHRGEACLDQSMSRAMTYNREDLIGKDIDSVILQPLDKAPYYAAEIAPSSTGTHGGPALNEFAQCLHVSGKPIGRLYGCGNFTGFGGPGAGYPGAGGTIGPGLVMAYIAAGHALEHLEDWK